MRGGCSWTLDLGSLTGLATRYMNAEKYGLDRIYFGGCFIRGECLITVVVLALISL